MRAVISDFVKGRQGRAPQTPRLRGHFAQNRKTTQKQRLVGLVQPFARLARMASDKCIYAGKPTRNRAAAINQ
jgi:hypothetical protein